MFSKLAGLVPVELGLVVVRGEFGNDGVSTDVEIGLSYVVGDADASVDCQDMFGASEVGSLIAASNDGDADVNVDCQESCSLAICGSGPSAKRSSIRKSITASRMRSE